MQSKICKWLRIMVFAVILISIIAGLVKAESHIPIGLQRIIDYNQNFTTDIATRVSFAFAFLAGVLGILSPCILPFLPAYFSYTFKDKKNVTLMTGIFFLGFSLVFVGMGIVAGFLGETSLSVLQLDWLVTIAGVLLIGMGFMSMFTQGFSGLLMPRAKFKNDIPGTFLFGTVYAIGWSACLGPILVGILSIGALLHDPVKSGLLMFFYSLGNLVPLFILSMFWDSYNLGESKFVRGKKLKFKIDEDEYSIDSTKLISGLLFILLGSVMVIFKGTAVVNSWDFFRTKQYFYSVQDFLIQWQYSNLLGIALLVIFIGVVCRFFWKRRK